MPSSKIHMKKLAILLVMLNTATVFGGVTPWATPAETGKMMNELREFMRGAEVRYPGSAGNLAMEEKISSLFAASGLRHGEIKFRSACFVPGETLLTLPDQQTMRIYPMHPTCFRPGNFKEKEFDAPLVYLGQGLNEDIARIKGTRLDGALVLLEFNCGQDWHRLLRFGVKGFIFIEPESYEYREAMFKINDNEVAVPRFLASRADGAALKTIAETAGKVHVRATPSRWTNKFLRDLWVLIPGTNPDLCREAAVIIAPMDSNCIVPELAAGAQAAANLFCLRQLLADFVRQPPARSVLLVAVNAQTSAKQGERMLAWHMLVKEEEKEKLLDQLNKDLRIQQALIDNYSQLRLDGYNQEDEELLLSWRSLVDESSDRNITVKAALVALAKRDINRLKNEQIAIHQQNPDQKTKERIKEIRAQCEKYVKVLTLFNKVGIRTKLSDLSKEETAILKGYVREVIQTNTLYARLNREDLLLERQNDAVREVLQGRKIAFLISLALDWTAPQIGFSAGPYRLTQSYARDWSRRWGVNSFDIAECLEQVRNGKPNLLADTLSMRGGYTDDYYFLPNKFGAASFFQNVGQVAAFDLLNVFGLTGNMFLPSDTIENLNQANLASQISFLPSYLRELFGEPSITDPAELDISKMFTGKYSVKAIQLKTFKFNEFSASVLPEVPVPNTAVIIFDRSPYSRMITYNPMIALTDERAATVFHCLTMGGYFATAAFHYDEDFTTVDHAIDAGDIQKKMNSDALRTGMTLPLFECLEFPIYTRDDSSCISASPIRVNEVIPLTAKGNTSPRKYGLGSVRSVLSKKQAVGCEAWNAGGDLAALYFSGDEKIKIITARKRLALNATEKEPEGRGYGSAAELGTDFFRNAAGDMAILNHARLKKLKDVAGDLAREFAARGDRCLCALNTALAQNDHLRYLRKLYEGLGAHVKSYEQIKGTGDDMLKAVVVYMALLLPFCFFIEKLFFNFVKIEHELGMFALFFTIAFIIFRKIHPAFRLVQTAEVIFIAFIIGALGLFVISILRGRFEGEMQLLFRSYLSGITDEAVYSTVTQKAMLIGVNNMKRRRIRTLLTTMTIVLIAFAMLSFTSISKKVNPTIIHKNASPPYTGCMFHWPGKAQMEEATLAVMRDLFSAHGQVVVRRWKESQDMPFHVSVNNGKEMLADTILGLTATEDGFLDKFPILAGRFFSADDAHEALLSRQAAENFGIDPAKLEGVMVNCLGYDLRVIGIYDDIKIKNLQDLNGIPILPIKKIPQLVGAWSSAENEDVKEELDELGSILFVDPLSLLIVPCDIAQRMGSKPYSISVKMKDDAPVWPLMDFILTATRAKFYISSLQPFTVGDEGRNIFSSGIYYIGSNYKTSIGGLAILIIPLFIAATIILNTMLGSVYERKKEIAVYNAIGLNPHHIGLFFLAESFVYGVIGSVGGYLIGQVLSFALNYSGLIKGINFNYSSLSVAYVILFTVALVLLSTIYPAMAAVRTAVPSGKRTWSMPQHRDNLMEVVFPFIYQPKIAAGVLAYLEEYFAHFTEISIGDFIAESLAQKCSKDEKARDQFNLDYKVALAPYDLGVTENLKFRLAFDDYVQAYRLVLAVERLSGQDVNWITTNRPFLEHLRKYLMRWRNLDLGQQKLYVQQAADLFKRS